MANSNPDWEASQAEKYAERWWKKNGFDVNLLKRYQSKSIYAVSRDGMATNVEIPYTVRKFKGFMEQFQKGFDLQLGVEEMKRQLDAQQEQ